MNNPKARRQCIGQQGSQFRIRVVGDPCKPVRGNDGNFLKRGDWPGIAVRSLPAIPAPTRIHSFSGSPMRHGPVPCLQMFDALS